MLPSARLVAALALLTLNVACSTARDPARGFRLSGTADIRRGKAAFLEDECNRCHEIAGANLPGPEVQRIVLGGSVNHQPSDGYLVTAIINPAYHAANYPLVDRPPEGVSAMPHYAQRMTVQQLADIVGYLQTRYSLRPIPVKSEFSVRRHDNGAAVRSRPVYAEPGGGEASEERRFRRALARPQIPATRARRYISDALPASLAASWLLSRDRSVVRSTIGALAFQPMTTDTPAPGKQRLTRHRPGAGIVWPVGHQPG